MRLSCKVLDGTTGASPPGDDLKAVVNKGASNQSCCMGVSTRNRNVASQRCKLIEKTEGVGCVVAVARLAATLGLVPSEAAPPAVQRLVDRLRGVGVVGVHQHRGAGPCVRVRVRHYRRSRRKIDTPFQ